MYNVHVYLQVTESVCVVDPPPHTDIWPPIPICPPHSSSLIPTPCRLLGEERGI